MVVTGILALCRNYILLNFHLSVTAAAWLPRQYFKNNYHRILILVNIIFSTVHYWISEIKFAISLLYRILMM